MSYRAEAMAISRTALLLIVGCVLTLPAAQPGATKATLFEGARLITGDERPPIESSAFLVEHDRFTRVGRKGDVQALSLEMLAAKM